MYFLSDFCCICMNNSDLKHLFTVDNDGESYYNKLTSSIAEMDFKEMNNQRLICGECCIILNTVYNFRRKCLRSKTNLINYISQLQTFSTVRGILRVCLKDINPDLRVVKKEIEVKNENDNSYQQEITTANFHSIYISTSIKEECGSEEDSSHDDEGAPSNVKEDDEDQTMRKNDREFNLLKSMSNNAVNNLKMELDSDDIEENCIEKPPDIASVTTESSSELLPAKSKKLYERAYTDFKQWCDKKSVDNYSESVLLAYFLKMSKVYKASSLWSYFSKIKSTLLINHNVDISKYLKLTTFLKEKSESYEPKKSKVLTREQILKFIEEAPDDVYLMYKVALIMGIVGALRCQELLLLTIDEIEDQGEVLYVNVKDTKKIDRSFCLMSSKDKSSNFIELYRKYAKLRPSHTKHRRFFIFYKNGKCSTQVVGKNTLGKIPNTVAAYLNLPDCSSYTGHCMRSSSASLLADAGADITKIKRRGECEYIESKKRSKNKPSTST